MKKLLLLSAILLGAATASQAGVRLDIGLPLPPLPGITFRPPVCVEAPRAYYGYPYGYSWYPRHEQGYRWNEHRDWDRRHDRDDHHRGGDHDYHGHR